MSTGVYINMEMPTSCGECKFFAWKRGVGQHCAVDDRITFHATLDGFDVGYERNGNCPLVPVQPHGALMDRDDFFAVCPELVDGYKRITDDLVIFPAEEGET